ncbi:hypothetical protein [Rubritalea tangerina]|uniref:hypothetical protein n=1 Tax=Rubritalea tangerina TaxID=430798 RepID=UPI00360BFFA5
MFFFLIDGPKLVGKIVYYLPLKPEHREAMLGRFLQVTRATLKGSVVIGFIQGHWGLDCILRGLRGLFFGRPL